MKSEERQSVTSRRVSQAGEGTQLRLTSARACACRTRAQGERTTRASHERVCARGTGYASARGAISRVQFAHSVHHRGAHLPFEVSTQVVNYVLQRQRRVNNANASRRREIAQLAIIAGNPCTMRTHAAFLLGLPPCSHFLPHSPSTFSRVAVEVRTRASAYATNQVEDIQIRTGAHVHMRAVPCLALVASRRLPVIEQSA